MKTLTELIAEERAAAMTYAFGYGSDGLEEAYEAAKAAVDARVANLRDIVSELQGNDDAAYATLSELGFDPYAGTYVDDDPVDYGYGYDNDY